MQISCPEDSEIWPFLEAQNEILLHLVARGLLVPKPIPNKDGKVISFARFKKGDKTEDRAIRLLTYIPGSTLAGVYSVRPRHYFEV